MSCTLEEGKVKGRGSQRTSPRVSSTPSPLKKNSNDPSTVLTWSIDGPALPIHQGPPLTIHPCQDLWPRNSQTSSLEKIPHFGSPTGVYNDDLSMLRAAAGKPALLLRSVTDCSNPDWPGESWLYVDMLSCRIPVESLMIGRMILCFLHGTLLS
jgi:hypothetical protein